MVIKFKYRIPENLKPLVDTTVVDYGYDYLYGLMPEGLANQLKHCSLYMICEFESIQGVGVWRNPIAVVGNNEFSAMETYTLTTHKHNGSILCEIVNRCDKIKVQKCD